MKIIACAAANGFVIPPLYLVPGQRINHEVMNACKILESRITTANKGFMNSAIFMKWLEHFKRNIPGSVQCPILLVYDGCGSHYNQDIMEKAIELKVLLVLLPANSTHLIQPLDIAVFKLFKTVLKH